MSVSEPASLWIPPHAARIQNWLQCTQLKPSRPMGIRKTRSTTSAEVLRMPVDPALIENDPMPPQPRARPHAEH